MILIAAIVLGAVALIVLFLIGFFAPWRARGTEEKVDRNIDRTNDRAKSAPRPVSSMADTWLRRSKKAADKSVESGHEARERTS